MGIGTFEYFIMSHLNQEANSELNRYGDNVFPFNNYVREYGSTLYVGMARK